MSRTKKTAGGGALSGELLPPTPRINLSTSEHIRQEMGRVYREARTGKMTSSEAAKLVYVLSQMLRAHELYVIETRLAGLEAASEKRKSK